MRKTNGTKSHFYVNASSIGNKGHQAKIIKNMHFFPGIPYSKHVFLAGFVFSLDILMNIVQVLLIVLLSCVNAK